MKRRILVITDFALYLVDPDADILKRRIALTAVDKLCISKLSDNFFAIIVPTEYDCLMASTRKKEIVDIIIKAIKSNSEYQPQVASSNRYMATVFVMKLWYPILLTIGCTLNNISHVANFSGNANVWDFKSQKHLEVRTAIDIFFLLASTLWEQMPTVVITLFVISCYFLLNLSALVSVVGFSLLI